MFQSCFSQISKAVIKHHKLYPPIKIESTYWEFILVNALEKNPMIKTKWKPGSHQKGTDINIFKGTKELKISCKAGVIKNNQVEFSAYRTSSLKTLKEKINYLQEEINKEDMIAFLAINKKTKKCAGNKFAYTFFTMDSKKIKLKDLKWKVIGKSKKNQSYEGTHPNLPFSAKIHESMSGQLWVTLDLKLLNKIGEITL